MCASERVCVSLVGLVVPHACVRTVLMYQTKGQPRRSAKCESSLFVCGYFEGQRTCNLCDYGAKLEEGNG